MRKSDFISQNFGFFGCSCHNECPTTLSNDNLVLMGLDYHGHYEDDDCYFTYINAMTGEISHDTWSTRFGCPAFNSYLRVWWQDAIESGLISGKMAWDAINKRWMEAIETELNWIITQPSFYYVARRYGIDNLNIPCVVGNRCRDYKGKATLLRFVEVESSFSPYGPYGRRIVRTDAKAKVLGEDGNIYTIGHQLAQIDLSDIVRRFRKLVNEDFESTSVWASIFPFTQVDLSEAKDVKEDIKKSKYEDFKASKMPGLIDWCRSKAPEKSEEEIIEWAEKIFARKYPMK